MLNPETVKSVLEQQDELVERSVQETSIEALDQLASYLLTSSMEMEKLAKLLTERARTNIRLADEVRNFLSTIS